MKKLYIAFLILCLCLLCVAPTATVYAEDQSVYYYVVEDADMQITTKNIEGSTIMIPATWYVKFISPDATDSNKLVVEYNGVQGTVPRSSLSKKSTTSTPGGAYFSLDRTLSVTSGGFLLNKNNTDATPIGSMLAKDTKLTFIASSTMDSGNEALSLVKTEDGRIGFFNNSSLSESVTATPNNQSVNPDLATDLDGDELLPDGDNPPTGSNNNLLRILLITAICLLAVVIVFLIFRPAKPRKRKDDYYED